MHFNSYFLVLSDDDERSLSGYNLPGEFFDAIMRNGQLIYFLQQIIHKTKNFSSSVLCIFFFFWLGNWVQKIL